MRRLSTHLPAPAPTVHARVVLAAALIGSLSCRVQPTASARADIPLELSPTTLALTVGDSARLFVQSTSAAAYVSNSATWRSNDAAVASISANGWLYARGKGTATITVTDGTHSASSIVTVTRPDLADLTVVAHRGYAGVFPENTLIAVHKAFDLGADAVEVDVALSADSVPMILHDDTVDRTTNGSGPIRSFTSSQLRALDACSKAGSQWQPCPVPYAREILEEAHGRGRLLLHLKGSWPNSALDRLVALVHSRDMARDVTVIAFEHYWLEYLHTSHPEITLGYLARHADDPQLFLGLGDGAGLYYDSVLVANPSFASSLRQQAIQHGAALGAWTINSKARAATLRGLGAGWLISDVPLSKDSLAAISLSAAAKVVPDTSLPIQQGAHATNAPSVRGTSKPDHQASSTVAW